MGGKLDLKPHMDNKKNDFDITDFTNASEIKNYAEKLKKLTELKFDSNLLMSILDKLGIDVKKLLAELAKLYNIFSMFDLSKLDEFLNSLTNMIKDIMGSFGINLDMREALLNLFNNTCNKGFQDISNNFNLDMSFLSKFALDGILMGLICSGNTDIIGKIKSELNLKISGGDTNAKKVLDTLPDVANTILIDSPNRSMITLMDISKNIGTDIKVSNPNIGNIGLKYIRGINTNETKDTTYTDIVSSFKAMDNSFNEDNLIKERNNPFLISASKKHNGSKVINVNESSNIDTSTIIQMFN